MKADKVVHSTAKVEKMPPLDGPYLRLLATGKKRMMRA